MGRHPYGVVADPQTDRTFVVNTLDRTISVLDTRRATVLRSIPFAGMDAVVGVAVDGHHHVLIAGSEVIIVLDARSGAVQRTIPLAAIAAGMALDVRTGRLFVTQGTQLRMLDARSGRVLRTATIGGSPGQVAVDSQHARVFVVNANLDDLGTPRGRGRVSVVDMRTGTVLRTMAVGVAPNALAVDERTGRVIVVNAGGSVSRPDTWARIPVRLRRWLPFLPRPATTTATEPGSVSILDPSG